MNFLLKNPLIVVAMESEESALLEDFQYQSVSIWPSLGIVAHQLEIGLGRQVAILRSGIGLVQAGATVAIALEGQKSKLQFSSVILLGVAGALDQKLSVGSHIIGTEFIQHDSIISGSSGFELMAPGFPFLSAKPAERQGPIMKADAQLIQLFSDAFEKKNLGKAFFKGLVLSGSEFVGTAPRKLELKQRFPNAWIVDMETSAIAQITKQYKIPFIAIKTVVDTIHPPQDIHSEYLECLQSASKSAKAILEIITGHST